MKKFDALKELSATDFAYAVCVDNVGDVRGVCAICQRHHDDDCDDRCISGVVEYLESEVEQ